MTAVKEYPATYADQPTIVGAAAFTRWLLITAERQERIRAEQERDATGYSRRVPS